MLALLSENAGCPQCGSIEGRRWRSYSGIELCTDCEWDYFSELNGRKLLDAKRAAASSVTTLSLSRRATGPIPGSVSDHPQPGLSRVGVPSAQDRRGHRSPTGSNSICRSCGHIYYSRILERCLRCRGLCEHRSDHDLTLMSRYAQRFIEAER